MQNKKSLIAVVFTFSFLISSCQFLEKFQQKPVAENKSNKQEKVATIHQDNAWQNEAFSGFQENKTAIAQNYMISTSDKLASQAGSEILERGGNAIDAAIAAQMVLNVVEPESSGIGGGLFLLYYDAKTKKTIYFNGRETAPMKAHAKMFLDKKGEVRKFEDVVAGGLSVGTPGALKALEAAHKKYGKLPWKDLFAHAIAIANDGFAIDAKTHVTLNQKAYFTKFPDMKIYFDGSKAKAVGTIIKNPDLAKTFTAIANKGSKVFYQGKIANDIVSAVQNSKENPGYLQLADLKKYKSKSGKLLCGSYRVKYKICSMPLPSSGGITLLQIMGILENFDLEKIAPSSPQAIHLISEATRLAYADRDEYIGDVKDVPLRKMLAKKYLKNRAKLIKENQAMMEVLPGVFVEKSDKKHSRKKLAKVQEKPSTTHLSIVDMEGNAVAMTSSIEYLFGSALMVDGFMLNNQLTDFSLAPKMNGKEVANAVKPGKQPRSSMTPTFVFDEKDNLVMIIGSPGGPRIIQFVAKTIIAALDWKMDIQRAISLPNHVILNNQIELENRTFLTSLKPALEKFGHKVVIADMTSGLNGIMIQNELITGGADPRREGAAIGK